MAIQMHNNVSGMPMIWEWTYHGIMPKRWHGTKRQRFKGTFMRNLVSA